VGSPVENAERSLKVLLRLAPKIVDHADFERKLTSAPPALRGVIYETVVPHLKFKAWPLDRYVASAGRKAEAQQLPTVGVDGKLHAFRSAVDVSSLEKLAEDALAVSLAKQTLILVCAKCTRQQSFLAGEGETPLTVTIRARETGWIYDYTSCPPVEICPSCPTPLRQVN
jgi:hypothetical protein